MLSCEKSEAKVLKKNWFAYKALTDNKQWGRYPDSLANIITAKVFLFSLCSCLSLKCNVNNRLRKRVEIAMFGWASWINSHVYLTQNTKNSLRLIFCFCKSKDQKDFMKRREHLSYISRKPYNFLNYIDGCTFRALLRPRVFNVPST